MSTPTWIRTLPRAFHRFSSNVAGIVRPILAETLWTAGFFAGWALMSWGFSLIWGWKVWPFAGGLLLLSMCGWRVLFLMARDGLYALSKDDDK
jgi:hypothetical protein